MTIRFLDPVLINQIAAGEVVERPASVLKELLENSIDAGATHLHITLREGGKVYLSVRDNGFGMEEKDLFLCVERHATSKIPDNDLFSINSFGFRGEALAAISAIARVNILTRTKSDTVGLQLSVEGGEKKDILPVQTSLGTMIEVRDLFYATPARLKFLKSTSHELNHCMDVVERIALAHPTVSIEVMHNERRILDLRPTQDLPARLAAVMPAHFSENTLLLEPFHQKDELSLKGYISLTTYHSATPRHQYFFINQRPVKDKILHRAVKLAYQDYLPPKRHGLCCLFLTIDPMLVDVNVHPAKTEVRFLNEQQICDSVRRFITAHLKEQGIQTNTTLSMDLATSLKPAAYVFPTVRPASNSTASSPNAFLNAFSHSSSRTTPAYKSASSVSPQPLAQEPQAQQEPETFLSEEEHPLGYAKAQFFNSYIVAQAKDALYIIDQHAAAERLLYEKLKKDLEDEGIKRQILLLPEVITLKESERTLLMDHRGDLETLGLVFESFGINEIILKEVPAFLSNLHWKTVILENIVDILHNNSADSFREKVLHKLATIACHHSVRFGQSLSLFEMNTLLRDIEKTPFAQQCNHGRPSFMRLEKKDLERLFERG